MAAKAGGTRVWIDCGHATAQATVEAWAWFCPKPMQAKMRRCCLPSEDEYIWFLIFFFSFLACWPLEWRGRLVENPRPYCVSHIDSGWASHGATNALPHAATGSRQTQKRLSGKIHCRISVISRNGFEACTRFAAVWAPLERQSPMWCSTRIAHALLLCAEVDDPHSDCTLCP